MTRGLLSGIFHPPFARSLRLWTKAAPLEPCRHSFGQLAPSHWGGRKQVWWVRRVRTRSGGSQSRFLVCRDSREPVRDMGLPEHLLPLHSPYEARSRAHKSSPPSPSRSEAGS